MGYLTYSLKTGTTLRRSIVSKITRKSAAIAVVAIAAAILIVAPAIASVTFDSTTGIGFIGKGDIQTLYNWKNKTFQDNARDVDFRFYSASETTWTCTKIVTLRNGNTNEVVQQKSSSTTIQGLVTTVARENSRGKDGSVTGFNLNGWEGNQTTTTEGPAIGSCPVNPSGFTYDNNAVTTQIDGSGLQVSIDGTYWSLL